MRVWKPTIEYSVAARFSCRNCRQAHGRRPVRGSVKTDRLHGTKRECFGTARGHDFNRQTALKVRDFGLMFLQGRKLRPEERLVERFVFVFGERAV